MEKMISKSKQLAMHSDSRGISKPKIRIIHIVAPRIIKTDVENFRCLVQRLTGKSDREGKAPRAKKAATKETMICPELMWKNMLDRDGDGDADQVTAERLITKEVVVPYLFKGSGVSTTAGKFGGFEDMDMNFVQDLSQFFLHPFKSSYCHRK